MSGTQQLRQKVCQERWDDNRRVKNFKRVKKNLGLWIKPHARMNRRKTISHSLFLTHTLFYLIQWHVISLFHTQTSISLPRTHTHTFSAIYTHSSLFLTNIFFILFNHIRISHTFLCNQITHTHLCISHTRFIKFNHTRPLSHASTRTLLSNSITHALSLSSSRTHQWAHKCLFKLLLSNSPEWMNYCLQRTRERRRERNDFCKKISV